MTTSIRLVPVGPVPADLVSWLAGQIGEMLGHNTVVSEVVRLPARAYDPGRGQYWGDALLSALRTLSAPASERVLALVDADCYAQGLNFIFGQATRAGREAFVALPRLRQLFHGLPEEPRLFRERALKEAVHELGHTWDLRHCRDRRCVMHFSASLHDTDVKGAAFCQRCRKLLTAACSRSQGS
jgi:archaemetzincin